MNVGHGKFGITALPRIGQKNDCLFLMNIIDLCSNLQLATLAPVQIL